MRWAIADPKSGKKWQYLGGLQASVHQCKLAVLTGVLRGRRSVLLRPLFQTNDETAPAHPAVPLLRPPNLDEVVTASGTQTPHPVLCSSARASFSASSQIHSRCLISTQSVPSLVFGEGTSNRLCRTSTSTPVPAARRSWLRLQNWVRLTIVTSRNTTGIRRNFNIHFMLCCANVITRIGFVRRFLGDAFLPPCREGAAAGGGGLGARGRPASTRVRRHRQRHPAALGHDHLPYSPARPSSHPSRWVQPECRPEVRDLKILAIILRALIQYDLQIALFFCAISARSKE